MIVEGILYTSIGHKRNLYIGPELLKCNIMVTSQKDGLIYVKVEPSGFDSWKLDPVIELLKEGAVGVIPTDTVYVIFPLIFGLPSEFDCVLMSSNLNSFPFIDHKDTS